MKTIEIDDQVYDELASRVRGFNETPNDVLRRVLWEEAERVECKSNDSEPSEMTELFESPEFIRGDSKSRYLMILGFLYQKDSDEFAKLEYYRRRGGKRVNFARDAKQIEASGRSTYPQQIPNTPYFVLTNLDNRSKQKILGDVMVDFDVPRKDIQRAQLAVAETSVERIISSYNAS